MARVSGRASPTRLRRPRCTPWEFPIHHGRRRQGLLHGDTKDVMDLQLLKVLSSPHPLPFPSLPHLVCFPSHAGQQGGTLASSTSSPRMTPLLHQDRVPKASDQTQLEAKEVRLSDMPPITLDDTNVQT